MISRVAFGHKIIIDTGASKPNNGSFKINVLSDVDARELYTQSGLVCPEGFRKNGDFTGGILKRINETYEHLVGSGVLGSLSHEDKDLTGIVIYSPGVSINNQTAEISNLKIKGTDVPLRDIDYNQIPQALRPLLANRGIKICQDFKLMATNDMIGAGAAIVKQLVNNPRFKSGYSALYLMAGGGLGVGQIDHLGENVLIKSSEDGHINVYGTKKNLEQYGASSTALIRNFADAVGMNAEDTQKLVNAGIGKVVNTNLVFDDAKEVQTLMDTGLFEIVSKGSSGVHLNLKNVSQEAKNGAVKTAIERFIDAISIVSANKVNEGLHEIILTGPLTKGIQSIVAQEGELFGHKSFDSLVKEKINSLLDAAGNCMKDTCKMELITDLETPNNTVGGSLALHGHFIGSEIRGNWLSIPTEVLNKFKRV